MSLTPAEQRLEGIRKAVSLYDNLVGEVPHYEANPDSADFLRKLFPELDDMTLAAFAAYVCVNAITIYSRNETAGIGLFLLGLVFGERTKQLAWSLDTPEAPEPETKEA